MKKNAPLAFIGFLILFCTSHLSSQTVGGWGICEFVNIATMNSVVPSNANTCKRAFVQSTNAHYKWDGSIWVQDVDPAGDNIYTKDDTLQADRKVTMDGNDLTFDGTSIVQITDSALIVISDNQLILRPSNSTTTADAVISSKNSMNFFTDNANGSFTADFVWGTNGSNTLDFNLVELMRLDDNGQLKLSAYGNAVPNYATGDEVYFLGVEADGDVVEVDAGFMDLTPTESTFQNNSNQNDSSGIQTAWVYTQALEAFNEKDGTSTGIILSDDNNFNTGTDEITFVTDGVAQVRISPQGKTNGSVQLEQYGGGTITGTKTFWLAVDANGNIIEVLPDTTNTSTPMISPIYSTTYTFNGTDEDDWSPTGLGSAPFYEVFRIDTTSDTGFTGINSTGVSHGQKVTLLNVGTGKIRLRNQDNASTAANRLILPEYINRDVKEGCSITFIYDAISSRWRVYSAGRK